MHRAVRLVLPVFAAVIAPGAALAVDGVIEINQADVVNGNNRRAGANPQVSGGTKMPPNICGAT